MERFVTFLPFSPSTGDRMAFVVGNLPTELALTVAAGIGPEVTIQNWTAVERVN